MAVENKPMSHSSSFDPAPVVGALVVAHELHHLRSHWKWFLLLGVLLVACGTVAIVFPILGSVATVAVLAAIFLVAGVATIVGAFFAGKWSGLLVQVLFGLLYIAAAFVMTDRPGMSIFVITLFIAVSFIVGGIFRILAALMFRFPQWGWALLNGVVTMLVGLIIFRQLREGPQNALWVVGLLVGLEMLFAGWTWIMLSLSIRDLPEKAAA